MLDAIDRMSEFANEKYDRFQKIWTEFDDVSFYSGIALALWLIAFHSMTSFNISVH